MKFLLSAVAVLALSCLTASALAPQDLVGTWQGRYRRLLPKNMMELQQVRTTVSTLGENGGVELFVGVRLSADEGYPLASMHNFTFAADGKLRITIYHWFGRPTRKLWGTWTAGDSGITLSARGKHGPLTGTLIRNENGIRLVFKESGKRTIIHGRPWTLPPVVD
ncbi:MAG: hypothetical protein EOP85_00790 [Verrucomicrobiaceae bacterium]|nr:MAG: hypothetical protein EOP85_00790 [Verrucomicrobiaceae bacterium]